MKFIIDAQLPYLLCDLLKSKDFDVIHTLDLPEGNRTTDKEIQHIAMNESRVLITKDKDFMHSFLLQGIPPKLLLVRVGNMRNSMLLSLFRQNIEFVISLLEDADFVEVTNTHIVQHGRTPE